MITSDIVSSNGHRIIELNISYIEKYILEKNKFISLIKSFKKIDGLYMVKVLEHDYKSITRKIKKSPIII